jgi:hypothetical protein
MGREGRNASTARSGKWEQKADACYSCFMIGAFKATVLVSSDTKKEEKQPSDHITSPAAAAAGHVHLNMYL